MGLAVKYNIIYPFIAKIVFIENYKIIFPTVFYTLVYDQWKCEKIKKRNKLLVYRNKLIYFSNTLIQGSIDDG